MVTEASPVTSVVLPLPVRECWHWFREPRLIREWHGWEYDGLDDEIREIFLDNARVGEDHRSINLGTHLFTFFEDDGTTRLEVVRCPMEEDSPWVDYLPDIDEGWISFLQQLRFKLTRHPDEARHTLFYGGTPRDPKISPIEWIGLGQVHLQHLGARIGVTVGPGDPVTGELWFTSRNQVGVTVDDWGDGLLIVSNGPHSGPPYTKGQAMLTAYGLDEDARSRLAERWGRWWGHHYEVAEPG
jgi:hypothetical protein